MRCSQGPVYIVAHIADKTETGNIRSSSRLGIYGDHFVFLAQGLVLAFLVLFRFFELLAEVALAVAMHHRFVFIDAELFGYFFFIDLIVGTEGEIDHALSDDRNGQ